MSDRININEDDIIIYIQYVTLANHGAGWGYQRMDLSTTYLGPSLIYPLPAIATKHFGDTMFKIERFAGINYIILLSYFQSDWDALAER